VASSTASLAGKPQLGHELERIVVELQTMLICCPVDRNGMPDRRTLLIGGAAAVLLAGVVAGVLIGPSDFFVPEESTQVQETPTDGEADLLKRGSFTGAAGHDVSGNVALVRDTDGLALRFENYSQQQGPDVFIYVTPAATPDSADEIAASTKVRIDGGADNGESTKEGTFTQRLPENVSAKGVRAVSAWCDAFSTPFGYANLSSAGE
jgi:hypothetical protein